ncbi:hypothetical protein [Bradyrhizobium sp. 192]|uniref:nSTAND3 domain-containing NTPase n=1 Tax=Bradyrhizobium sp. 192 TaxID=2782660 RepID=UPI001FFF1E4C|nr:hypothetical protein [Bradyrhizobium sp. 192]
MTDATASPIQNSSSGATSLEGYLYQLDVSVWAALDLVLAKKLASQIVLEPVGEEDLEADLTDDDPGSIASDVDLPSYRLVIQAKLRNTGPWSAAEIVALLKHGKERMPAAERLRDEKARYLLVTSADLQNVARELRIANLAEWPKAAALPATIASALPATAAGRIGILSSIDLEKIAGRLRALLEDAFRVPHSRLDDCEAALRGEALSRMRGAGHGVWTRADLETVIRSHDGYIASSAEVESFVKPTNWTQLQQALRDNHAVIITGASGTGKTTASLVLLDELRAAVPGLRVVHVTQGPQQVRADQIPGPVVFSIEDPWGRYRFEPQSEPWNDELGKFLATATANRWFVITSRSDVLAESHARLLASKWYVALESDNYGTRERVRLFENRLPHLTRRFQAVAARYRGEALNQLRSPLEIQKYFDSLAEGPAEDENESQYTRRCIEAAHRDSIETTIVQQVETREAWAWATVVWGLLKARPKQSRALLPDIQAGLGAVERELEDGLEPFVNFLVNGRNLRQVESTFVYYHPRVEAGLEAAMERKPGRAVRVLQLLVDVLIALDTANCDDWGRESAAHLIQAALRLDKIALRPAAASRQTIDAWLAERLSREGDDFSNILTLAAAVGSSASVPSELARWLIPITRTRYSFGDSWSPDPDDDDWYQRMAAHPSTEDICNVFVRRVLPFGREGYPDDFADYLRRLTPNLDRAFLDAASSVVGHGFNSNADAIAVGALRNLHSFATVVDEAIAYQAKLRSADDPALWLAICNGEYSEDYAQHLAESASEDGHTADCFVKAYVEALRLRSGWQALRDHPGIADVLYAWIDLLRSSSVTCDDAEILALSEKAWGHRHESRFWSLVTKRWQDPLAPKLADRLVNRHPDHQTRVAAVECFAKNASASLTPLVEMLLRRPPSCTVELFIDLRSVREERDKAQNVDRFVSEFLNALPEPLREICGLAVRNVVPAALSKEALSVLHDLDVAANDEMRLVRAQLLSSIGQNVESDIDALLRSTAGDEQREIAIATEAVELAAARSLWPQVEVALGHRFADVRRAALKALAPHSLGALPERLLALAEDKGSGVRRSLLDLMEARRNPAHLDALVILAADNWTAESGYYGDDQDYPIATGAADILGTSCDLPERVLDRLLEIAGTSRDSAVRGKLLIAVARNGGEAGRTRVVDLAMSRENLMLSESASWALYVTGDSLKIADTARIAIEQLTTRAPAVAVLMSMTVGRAGTSDQALDYAKKLATHATRKGLLVSMMMGAVHRDTALADEIGKFLPPDLMTAIHSAFEEGSKLPRNALDGLGDVRVVGEVIRRFDFLFLPKKKS